MYVILFIRFKSVFILLNGHYSRTRQRIEHLGNVNVTFGVVKCNNLLTYNRSQMLILLLSAHLHVLYSLQFDLMLCTHFFPFITFSPLPQCDP